MYLIIFIMFLSKLRNKSIKTQQQIHHFYLDEQQQQIAFQAKRQLEECSQEIFDDFTQPKQPIKTKYPPFNNLRESALTRATLNEGKSVQSKAHVSARKENSCDHYKSICKKQQKKEKQQSKKLITGLLNSINVENNFFHSSLALQQSTRNRYLTKIQSKRKTKFHKSGFCGITFRSHTLEPETRENVKMCRLHSSRKNRMKTSFQQMDQTNTGKPYSFNDTMSGIKLCEVNKKRNNLKKLLNEEDGLRPSSCRGGGVQLRPQFLRLIMRIKQKQEVDCKKRMAQRGRKSRV